MTEENGGNVLVKNNGAVLDQTDEAHPRLTSEGVRRWMEGKTRIPADDLRLVEGVAFAHLKDDPDGRWYCCPNGCEDHAAFRPVESRNGRSVSLADILTCFCCHQQWFVETDTSSIIEREEKAYLDLLAGAEKTVTRVIARRGWSEETAAFLYETHGIPRDVSETFATAERGSHGTQA